MIVDPGLRPDPKKLALELARSASALGLPREVPSYGALFAPLAGSSPVAARSLNPCGQVEGGLFGPGNTCAKGDGTSFATPTSASNCPEPCGMLSPVSDGGELLVPDDAGDEGINWKAAEEVDGEVAQAVADYTNTAYEAANQLARAGASDDEIAGERASALDNADPLEIADQYGDKDLIPLVSSEAVDRVEDGLRVLERWEEDEKEAAQLFDQAIARARDGYHPPGYTLPSTLDPSVERYTSVSPSESKPLPNGWVYIPGLRDEIGDRLNGKLLKIREHRKESGASTARELEDKLAAVVRDNLPSGWSASLSRTKSYTTIDDYTEQAFEEARNSGDFPSGATVGSFDENLRSIASMANKDGPIVTWRSSGSGTDSLVEDLSKGDIFAGQGFLSTTASPHFAIEWKKSNLRTLWRVVGESGAPIRNISSVPDEWEVLYPNSTRFRVANVARGVTIKDSRGGKWTDVNVVDLVEEE